MFFLQTILACILNVVNGIYVHVFELFQNPIKVPISPEQEQRFLQPIVLIILSTAARNPTPPFIRPTIVIIMQALIKYSYHRQTSSPKCVGF